MSRIRVVAAALVALSCQRVELPNGYTCFRANAHEYGIVEPKTREVLLDADIDRLGVFGKFIVAHYRSLALPPKGFHQHEEALRGKPTSGYWILDSSSGRIDYLGESEIWQKVLNGYGVDTHNDLSPAAFLCGF